MKIVAVLAGGLGNQMFQYASARAFACQENASLVLDTFSDFIVDRQYRRRYELSSFALNGKSAKWWEILPYWVYKLRRYTPFYSIYQLLIKINFFQIVKERDQSYDGLLSRSFTSKAIYLKGYWQSQKYFEKIKDQIALELMPPPPRNEKFIQLAREMNSVNSVAVGIRLYEESKNPQAHARDGKLKGVDEINKLISRNSELFRGATFYIFCTHKSKELEKLSLNDADIKFVTHDDGYEGALERLWLLSHCKNHIFNNSSFYWWGAWLSHVNYKKIKQYIFAADNFTNVDCIPKEWNKF